MTIEEAIQRAKRLGQARLQKQERPLTYVAVRMATDSADSAVQVTVRQSRPHSTGAVKHRRNFDASACEQNRVLLAEEPAARVSRSRCCLSIAAKPASKPAEQNNWFSLAIASPSQSDGKSLTVAQLGGKHCAGEAEAGLPDRPGHAQSERMPVPRSSGYPAAARLFSRTGQAGTGACTDYVPEADRCGCLAPAEKPPRSF